MILRFCARRILRRIGHPFAEFGDLRRIEENLPNGAENAKILLILVNPFTYNS